MSVSERIRGLNRAVQQGRKRLDLLRATWVDLIYGGSEHAVKGVPYLRDGLSLQRYMAMPVLAVAPAALAGIYFFGWRTLVVIVVSYFFGGLVDLAFSLARGRTLNEGLLVTGILYALLLPPWVPLWLVALGMSVAILSREVFGGLGQNIFNPALVGKAFLIVIVPAIMTTHWAQPYWGGWGGFVHYAPQAVTALTPLIVAGQNPVGTPLWQLLVGDVPGALGATSGLLMLFAGLLLLFTRTIDWRISMVMIVTVGVLEWLLGMTMPERFGQGGWFLQILSGSLLFAAFLNATDPVTSPMTRRGKWIYAILIGMLVVLLRGLRGDPEGVTFSILIANAFVPLLDRWTLPRSFGGQGGSA